MVLIQVMLRRRFKPLNLQNTTPKAYFAMEVAGMQMNGFKGEVVSWNDDTCSAVLMCETAMTPFLLVSPAVVTFFGA